MAITTTTVYVAGGAINWLPSDVIVGIESAFTWLGWHSPQVTGIVTSISAVSGGGTITGSAYTYENNGNGQTFYYSDVPQSSSSGIGTGATFDIRRNNGTFSQSSIRVNRPGYGYTTGEVIQISAADIGGAANGAIGIAVTVNISAVGYGSTNAFFAKDLGGGASGTPWGVLKLQHQAGKKYGNTYYGFQVVNYNSNYTGHNNPTGFALKFASGSDFHPYTVTNTNNFGNGYASRFCGNELDDGMSHNAANSEANQASTTTTTYFNTSEGAENAITGKSFKFRSRFASSLNYPLNINIYRSAIDTNFAVISFAQPGISAVQLSTNSFCTFFIHKYSSTLWDLNDVFLEGITHIVGDSGNSTSPNISFTAKIGGNTYQGDYTNASAKSAYRSAEAGYLCASSSFYNGNVQNINSTYYSTLYPHNYPPTDSPRIYSRNNSDPSQTPKFGVPVNYATDPRYMQSAPSSTNYNAVIKGIPLSTVMIPCPYYLPDDFVLIDFSSATDQQIIQQGDTVTVSGGEVYTVITGSYNQTTRTRGVLFCARKV